MIPIRREDKPVFIADGEIREGTQEQLSFCERMGFLVTKDRYTGNTAQMVNNIYETPTQIQIDLDPKIFHVGIDKENTAVITKTER